MFRWLSALLFAYSCGVSALVIVMVQLSQASEKQRESSPATTTERSLSRLQHMGVSASTAAVVQQKLSALTRLQQHCMLKESAVASQVKPPSLLTLQELPSCRRKTRQSKLLVLDLDGTLVHAGNDGDFEVVLSAQSVKVLVRPDAGKCLHEVSRLFEVAVYTAAEATYADQVLDHLDPSGQLIQHRLYRDSCLQVGPYVFKDLRVFRNFSMKHIIMVDNSVFGYAFQRANGVPVSTWTGDQSDSELSALVAYLRLLAPLADVRPFNSAVFSPFYHLH